jgi:hypothetical protein
MDKQGAHYKVVPGEQHHERAMRLKLNWYAANITKYAERAPYKGQLVEDLIKVIDYSCMWLAAQGLEAEQLDRVKVIISKLDTWADRSGEATGAYTNQK